jgi:hypothetical protein
MRTKANRAGNESGDGLHEELQQTEPAFEGVTRTAK